MLGVASVSVFAQENPAANNGAKEAVKVNNKLCPVSGEKVGEMGDPVTYEYNGRIYNFCCSSCLSDFKKDPDKFAKIAEADAAEPK
ncbi:MAG: TRASH domain-containing protein [Candidatus Omnitrophica bacterium]|nr:TRASH domain-containing protein [Candidatus Omnitrophota bacterium]